MAKGAGAGMTPLRVREVRAFLEAAGYTAARGKQKHLKFHHPRRPLVLLPLQPQEMLSLSAARQIATALGYADTHALIAAVQAKAPPPEL
ncbi:MAG TPA: type II toxin-antitoxin system HicA family toxin [Thermomicrobiales bacterium]|nr:type II toxin-antitoxin system HicA family toxin [Thermomicrobiales bacterium]